MTKRKVDRRLVRKDKSYVDHSKNGQSDFVNNTTTTEDNNKNSELYTKVTQNQSRLNHQNIGKISRNIAPEDKLINEIISNAAKNDFIHSVRSVKST